MAIVYSLESPRDKMIKYNTIVVEGWAFSTDSNMECVEVHIGKSVFTTEVKISRDDVGESHPHFFEKSSKSGFRLEIKFDYKMNKKTDLKVIIKAQNGERVELKIQDMRSEDYVEKIKRLDNFKKAIKKTVQYFKDGKSPQNINELVALSSKFFNIIKHKNISQSTLVDKLGLSSYEIWCLKNSGKQEMDKLSLDKANKTEDNCLISIVMPVYSPGVKEFLEALKSIKNQYYSNWELIVIDDCSPEENIFNLVEKVFPSDPRVVFQRLEVNSNISIATNAGVDLAKGEFVFLMDHDDLITENALYEVARVIDLNPDIQVIYSDDDKISMDDKRFDPQFKPDFSPELLLSYMYFSHIFVIKKNLFEEVGGCRVGFEGSQDYDLALRISEKTTQIYHIPKILYHWRATPTSTATSAKTKPKSIINGKKAVEDAVKRRGIPANVIIPDFADKGNLGIFVLKYASEKYPLISIIIPTKNHKNILKRCIDSIELKTTYPNYEIIIVDNNSDDPNTIDYLASLKHKIVKCDDFMNKFNFSKLVNFGVSNSNGEYIVLLNNDTEVISESWLEDMLVYLLISGVGVVGAKLLYEDNLVQHAGVVIKMFNGIAGHAFKLLPNWDGGYLSYANVPRNYSAVTAACFMTTKEVYNKVGGFDEQNFGVSFNDVDFCLKALKEGYRIVYNPEALLYHHEGKSRGVEQTGHFSDSNEEYNFVSKWKIGPFYSDPYYNPNLSLINEKFELNIQDVFAEKNDGMKILFITHNLNYEGAPLMQLNIAKGLVKLGHEIHLLSPKDGPLRKLYSQIDVKVQIFDVNASENFSSKKSYNNLIDSLIETVKQYHFDVVYTNTIETFYGVRLADKLNLPSVWGIHESVDYLHYFSGFDVSVQKEAISMFSMSTKVVYVADASAELYKNLNTYNFKTVKNGIDISNIERYMKTNSKESVRKRLGISNQKKVISIFGAVCLRKGQKIFVEAAKKIIENGYEETKFFIVGAKPSTYLDELKIYISNNNLNENIEIIPVCDDIFQYYRASDIFVCASYEESSPQVILEAMSFRLPIVSTNVFGIPELVRNNQEALLCNPGDAQAISRNIQNIIDDERLTEKLVQNAYYRVKTKFTFELMIKSYNKLLISAYNEGENNVYKLLMKRGHK